MNDSIKRKLLIMAKERGLYVNGGEFERYALSLGYKASNASRRLRELYDEGYLERRMNGRSVEYKYKQREPQTLFADRTEELAKLGIF